MKVTASVVSSTRGRGIATLEARIKDAARAKLLVGIPEGKTEPGGTSSAQVGRWMQFGTPTIAARPWLTEGIRRALPGVHALNKRTLSSVMRGSMTVDQALGLSGEHAAGVVRATIVEGPWAPNAPSTIKQKGSDRPLIDSGQMRQNVTYVVRR